MKDLFRLELKEYANTLLMLANKEDISNDEIDNLIIVNMVKLLKVLFSNVLDIIKDKFGDNVKFVSDIFEDRDPYRVLLYEQEMIIKVTDTVSVFVIVAQRHMDNVKYDLCVKLKFVDANLAELYVKNFIHLDDLLENAVDNTRYEFTSYSPNALVRTLKSHINKFKKRNTKIVDAQYKLDIREAVLSYSRYKDISSSVTTFKYYKLTNKDGVVVAEGISPAFLEHYYDNYNMYGICNVKKEHLKNVPTYKSYTHFLKASGVKRNECNIEMYAYNKNLKCDE